MDISINTKIVLIACLSIFSACSQVNLRDYEQVSSIEKYSSSEDVLNYLDARETAVKKLNDYAPKRKPKKQSWFAQLFSKTSHSEFDVVEEVQVFGLRASEIGAMPDANVAEALMRVDGVSITNNQEAAVDEGGIVKRKGNNLIVLRKGKLYSIHIGAQLTKTDEIDLQPEGWKHEAWYDELLVYNNILVVIGFSYENDSSEYVFFELDGAGKFSRKGAYLVSSGDYYSEKNYAGRLVGDKLIFYIENMEFDFEEENTPYDRKFLSPFTARIDEFGNADEAYPLFSHHDIYSPVLTSRYVQFTTVVICPINLERFSCTAKSILGAEMESYYASSDAYYFWMRGSEWNIDYAAIPNNKLKRYARSKFYEEWPPFKYSAMYRIPFNNDPIGIVKIKGVPIDQFSFKQGSEHLHILAREGVDERDWFYAEYEQGSTFVASIPLKQFENGISELPEYAFTKIAEDNDGKKINRFVGNKLVYASDNDEVDEKASTVYVLDMEHPETVTEFLLESEMQQLHPIGKNILLVEYNRDKSTQYQTLALENTIQLVDTYAEPDSKLAESRSHGFFYKPDVDGGMFAMPGFTEVSGRKEKEGGGFYYPEDVADMLYTRVTHDLHLHPAGILEGDKTLVWDDESCDVSCYDWYGSSRPIFWGNRIFALLKYELIEGVREGDVVRELQRIDIRD